MQQNSPINPKLQDIIWIAYSRTREDLARGIIAEIGAWFLFALCVNFCGLLIFLAVSVYRKPDLGLIVMGIFMCGWWMYVAVKAARGFVYLRREARLCRSNPRGNLVKDPRDPVLYLRSFYDDYNDGYEESLEQLKWKTDEEVLTEILNMVGPTVALRGPNQPANISGAIRVNFTDEKWRAGVRHLMSISQLVVVQADISAGLLWELEAARKTVKPKRLLISFIAWQSQDKDIRQKLYLRFKKHFQRIFNVHLPEEILNSKFIVFRDDWTPELVTTDSFRRLSSFVMPQRMYQKVLREILKERGFKLDSSFGWRRYRPDGAA